MHIEIILIGKACQTSLDINKFIVLLQKIIASYEDAQNCAQNVSGFRLRSPSSWRKIVKINLYFPDNMSKPPDMYYKKLENGKDGQNF